jgi:RNA polymerase sigma-70 factor (ECF subfamily)
MFIRSNKKDVSLIEDDFFADESDDRLNEKLEKDALIDQLTMVLEELKQEQRLCIQLFYIQKKSYEEITQITQYNLKEVKSHLQNGRRNLKILLENRKEDHER